MFGSDGATPSAVPPSQHPGSTWPRSASASLPGTSQPEDTTPTTIGRRPRYSHRRDGALAWARRHALFLVALLVGIAWRLDMPAPTAAGHVLGLATGVVVYVLLLRWGVWRWLAALAAVPALWDAYAPVSRQIELADTVIVFVASVALLALCWRARPNTTVVLAGGMLVAAAATGWVTGSRLEARPPAADALGAYQGRGFAPLLFGCLLLALLGCLGVGRAGASVMRAVCLLTAAVPAAIMLAAVGTAELSWRAVLPGLVLWPAAGALGLTALLRGRRGEATARSQVDDVDRAALDAFRETYGNPTLAPVVVVIAAYNEVVGLPRVLDSMPSMVCGLAADVLVVDDGSTDGTADVAAAHGGAYLAAPPVNRGQGAAMRLGYRVARSHGARYLITTDADGQYDTVDFPTVLAPVLDGSADFVTGSRRLGRQHTVDRFRRTGVYVFAWIVSALTGERVTDTSFGLRAMRAELTAVVTLNQPQYQSAELLIGAHSHGYRLAEVPGTMHLRAAGSTKKGGNLVYGLRYSRVVLGTWWREGCPAPAKERAPAMAASRDGAGARLTSGR